MNDEMSKIQEDLKKDSYSIDMACNFIKQASLREEEMRKYTENLKASFDSEVQKTAMKILESTTTGMNDGGGTLKYTSN